MRRIVFALGLAALAGIDILGAPTIAVRLLRHSIILILFTATSAGAENLLQNPDFEGGYNSTAPGWSVNAWGNPPPDFQRTRETDNIFAGSSAQRVSVRERPNGGFIFKQDIQYSAGRTYEGTIALRSPDSVRVQFFFRRAGRWYEAGATRTITVGRDWQTVTIRGGFPDDVPGFFGVAFRSTGTLILDAARLRDVTMDYHHIPPPTRVIPARYFGMHINKLGTHPYYPPVNQGLIRLWDTGTSWKDIETKRGLWDWARLDLYVRTIENRSDDQIVYTMGITPAWASEDGKETSPPRLIPDWRRYVRTVARRYNGRIRYWEIWNETDFDGFYSGSVERMVELAKVAYEELKAANPRNIVLSPNITKNGLSWLDRYLAAGGESYVDIVSYHDYPDSLHPENSLPVVHAIRGLMENHGIGNKPLWNTEGAPSGANLTDRVDRGSVARSYLVLWAAGVENFSWYNWDIHVDNRVLLSSKNYADVRQAGAAYREVVSWLVGSRMKRRLVGEQDDWLIEIVRERGYRGYILWNTNRTLPYPLPSDWRVVRMRDLTGRCTDIAGRNEVTIGFEPILLEGWRPTVSGLPQLERPSCEGGRSK